MPAEPGRWKRPAPSWRRTPRSSRSPATSPTPPTAARSPPPPAPLDLLVNNASVLGPTRSRGSPTIRSTFSSGFRVNVHGAAGAVSGRPAGARAGRVRAQPHLRRRRRGVRGLGRLRLLEGRARAAHTRARRRAPGAADRRRRPRRHEHADAPGGVPGRGHLRPSAARGQRAGPAGDRVRRRPERPLPGGAVAPSGCTSSARRRTCATRRPRSRPPRRARSGSRSRQRACT